MAAIITDQIRILNAKNFLAGVSTATNAYYSFIGLPNATDIQTDWDTSPPSPKDNFNEDFFNLIGDILVDIIDTQVEDTETEVDEID